MGRKPRVKPERLGEKLRTIRDAFGLSQGELVKRLEAVNLIDAKHVSKFELGEREPSLLVLLRYARLAGISIDALADDDLNLPAKLPAKPKHS
ncbi:MAG TPA: helix-turn-helix transcriptional regulator [Pyrinomonadaceae bacterium]|nr:helix-turn-helix transcriptional regulator [Pyrinomonadaceae bacterium]